MSTAEKFEVLQAELDQALAEILKLKRQLQHQGEPVTDDEILKIADKAFGQVVDHDLRGNPITDFSVLTTGAYGPAIRRLVRLARTHADPAEVERLREELDGYKQGSRIEAEEADTLRTQVAEAHALLDVMKKYLTNNEIGAYERLLCRKIDALSASAEPSAPVEIDERAEFEAKFPVPRGVIYYEKDNYYADSRWADEGGDTYQPAWDAWQARAALEHKQQKTPQ